MANDTPVDTKSFARLEPLGLTGLNYIQVFAGGGDTDLMRSLPDNEPRRIEGQMSQLDTFLDDGGSVIESVQMALNRVNVVMSNDAIEDFQSILSNINTITDNLRDADIDQDLLNDTLVAIEKAAKDVSKAALEVDTTAKEFDALLENDVKSVIARAEVSMVELDKALGSIGTAADGTGGLITDSRDAINRISNSGLRDIEETIDAIRRMVIALGRVADSIEQNPRQFIIGAEKEVVELPQ